MRQSMKLVSNNVVSQVPSFRLPEVSRTAALHVQLYRYAEDLQEMILRYGELEMHCDELLKSSLMLIQGCDELQDLMRSSRDSHIVTDISGIILKTNPAAAMNFPEYQEGRFYLQEWVMPSHLCNFNELLVSAIDLQQNAGKELELHLRRKDGSLIIMLARILTTTLEGEVRQLHWILRDITALRNTELETHASTTASRPADRGMIITDAQGNIFSVNPAFCKITGYSAAEVIGRTPKFLCSSMHDARFYADFWHLLREKGHWQGKIYNRKKNGEVYQEWLEVSSARNADGLILSYIAVFSELRA